MVRPRRKTDILPAIDHQNAIIRASATATRRIAPVQNRFDKRKKTL
jgi:hypothetical protein